VELYSLQAAAILPFFTLGGDVEQTDCYEEWKNWSSRSGVAEYVFLLGRDTVLFFG